MRSPDRIRSRLELRRTIPWQLLVSLPGGCSGQLSVHDACCVFTAPRWSLHDALDALDALEGLNDGMTVLAPILLRDHGASFDDESEQS